MAERKRNPRYVTPKGTLIYPHISKPDTKFNANGEYKTEIELPKDAEMYDAKTGKSVGKILDFLTEQVDDAVAKFGDEHNGKKKKGKVVEVTESEDPPFYVDGDSLFVKFKLKAYVEPKNGDAFTQSPAIFDAKGKKFNPSKLWNGSVAKIAFEIVPYYNQKDTAAGITLRLKACQVITLVTGGDATGDAFGFGEEEGHEASEEDEGFDEEDGHDSDDDDDDDDDEGDDDNQEEDDDEGDF